MAVRHLIRPGVCPARGTGGGDGAPVGEPDAGTRSPRITYDPAQSSRIFLPTGEPVAGTLLVVLVPGGGWVSADPAGLTGLTAWLSEQGAAVVTSTYRTAPDGAHFPVPVQDIACVVPDRFVGLAGPYDVARIDGAVDRVFGPTGGTRVDRSGADPATLATGRADLRVLLVHGTDDTVVPVELSQEFEAALVEAGHEVTVRYLDGVDHLSVCLADVAGPVIADWLRLSG